MTITLFGYFALVAVLGLGYLLLTYSPDFRKERRDILEEVGFQAFRERYPNAFANGQVTCPFCSGHGFYIRTQHRPYLRQHSCRTCGRPLYYS